MEKNGLIVVNGDITKVHNAVIVHQVNCQGVMGAGVAKSLYEKWPQVRKDYMGLFKERGLGPHDVFRKVQTVDCGDNVVCNSFSQFNYGHAHKTGTCYTDADALEHAIDVICRKYPDKTVCVPAYVGCGLAGGNWDEISSRLSRYPVCAVRFEDGVTPKLPTRGELNEHAESIRNFDEIAKAYAQSNYDGEFGGSRRGQYGLKYE